MNVGRRVRASLVVSAVALGLAALHYFQPILAPVSIAVLIIALVWPLQRRLHALMPQLAAVALTMLATLVAAASTADLATWGISGIVRWVNKHASHLQGLHAGLADWLERSGLDSVGMLSDQFSISTVMRLAREVDASLQGVSSLLLLTLIFVILGLLAVDDQVRRLRAVAAGNDGHRLLGTGHAFALMQWGVLAFVLNIIPFIPFIRSLVATILPSVLVLMLMQFKSMQTALLVFLGANAIQFLISSYIEPRLAGAAVSISPFMVLFSVFFFGSLWGFFDALIGVPLLIAAARLLEHHDSTRWIATLVTGPPRPGPHAASKPR